MDNLGIKSNLDKFYTKPEVAAQCIEYASTYFSCVDTFLEPSAGNGSFLNLLTPYKKNSYSVRYSSRKYCYYKSRFFIMAS